MHAKIYYEDFPQCDSSDIAVTTNDLAPYCSTSTLTKDPFLDETYNYASWEENYMDADGEYRFFTEERYTQEYVSNSFTNNYGYFTENPVITITLTKTISSSGIGIYQIANIGEPVFTVELLIKWYRDDVQIASVNTYVDEHERGYIYKTVEDYNKVTIEIKKYSRDGSFTADVSRRARLYRITLGQTEVFEGDNLYSVNLNLTTSLTSEKIEGDTGNIVVVSEERFFQAGQKISVYYNDNLISAQQVDTAERNGNKYTLNTVSLLKYLGDNLISSVAAGAPITMELYNDVFSLFEGVIPSTIYATANKYNNGMQIINEMSEMPNGTRVSGKVSKQISKKDALVYLCIAAAAYVYEKSGNIYMKDMYTAATTPKFTIPEENVFSGDKYTAKSPYKYVEITTIDANGAKTVNTLTNTSNRATSTSKKLTTEISPNTAYMAKLKAALEWYYFKSNFYTAKAKIPITDTNYMLYPGDYVKINNIECVAEVVKLNLSGNIVIADATYKVV